MTSYLLVVCAFLCADKIFGWEDIFSITGTIFGALTFLVSLTVLNYLVLIMFRRGPILLALTLVLTKFIVIVGGAYIASLGDRSQVLGFIAGLLLFVPAAVIAPKPKI